MQAAFTLKPCEYEKNLPLDQFPNLSCMPPCFTRHQRRRADTLGLSVRPCILLRRVCYLTFSIADYRYRTHRSCDIVGDAGGVAGYHRQGSVLPPEQSSRRERRLYWGINYHLQLGGEIWWSCDVSVLWCLRLDGLYNGRVGVELFDLVAVINNVLLFWS